MPVDRGYAVCEEELRPGAELARRERYLSAGVGQIRRLTRECDQAMNIFGSNCPLRSEFFSLFPVQVIYIEFSVFFVHLVIAKTAYAGQA